MSDAVQIIQQELETIDEKLTLHAYHKAVLENLLKRMKVKTGALDLPKPKRRQKNRGDSASVRKRQEVRVNNARTIATLVRDRRLTKTQAISNLMARNALVVHEDWANPIQTILSDTSPTGLGKRLHNQLFAGTIYGQ